MTWAGETVMRGIYADGQCPPQLLWHCPQAGGQRCCRDLSRGQLALKRRRDSGTSTPQRSSPFSFFFWCGLRGRSNYAKIRALIIICKWGSCSEEAIMYRGKVWIDWLWVWEEPRNCHPSSIRLLDLANVPCNAGSGICKTPLRNPVLINVSVARRSPPSSITSHAVCWMQWEKKYSATGLCHRLVCAALDVLQDVSWGSWAGIKQLLSEKHHGTG